MDNPLVSVIITTRNSSTTLNKLLGSIQKQIYKKIEIILVDNNSSDNTKELARKFTKRVFQMGPERSTQRNFGVTKSLGKYLLILDSDMILTKNIVKECVELCEADKEIGAVVIPERSIGVGIWAKAKILEREINSGEEFFEAARFFPKKIFLEFGGYDKNLTGPEDWDLPRRIVKNYTIGRVKSKILHNEGELTLLTLFRKKYYYGLSAHKYLTKQKIPVVSPVTVYFLRPAFYKRWWMLFKNPLISLGMIVMLTVELIGGGLGYLIGRFTR